VNGWCHGYFSFAIVRRATGLHNRWLFSLELGSLSPSQLGRWQQQQAAGLDEEDGQATFSISEGGEHESEAEGVAAGRPPAMQSDVQATEERKKAQKEAQRRYKHYRSRRDKMLGRAQARSKELLNSRSWVPSGGSSSSSRLYGQQRHPRRLYLVISKELRGVPAHFFGLVSSGGHARWLRQMQGLRRSSSRGSSHRCLVQYHTRKGLALGHSLLIHSKRMRSGGSGKHIHRRRAFLRTRREAYPLLALTCPG
jgi:hypothetical protein